MRFRVLGCAGSIGGGNNTTSYLVDDDILIDAGTGLAGLPLEAMAKVDHVFLSHAHMDHISMLPMFADSVLSLRRTPITVYGTDATLDALAEGIFNWRISPNFREIPSPDRPTLTFQPVEPGKPVALGERRVTAIPVKHTIPTVAYHLDGGAGSIVVATDMTATESFWPTVNAIPNLRFLLIESAFQNARRDLCELTGHLCPSMLAEELEKLERPAEIFVVHMKPSAEPRIREEIAALRTGRELRILADGDVLTV